jgi:hypothetical protein
VKPNRTGCGHDLHHANGANGTLDVVVLMEPAEPERLLRCYSEAILATDAHNLRRCSGLTVGYVWVQERLGACRADQLRARADLILSSLVGIT